MSEEMKELQTNEVTETMADYEDHFDDANPWNRVQDYMDKKTVLPVKIEGVVNGGVIAVSYTHLRRMSGSASGRRRMRNIR